MPLRPVPRPKVARVGRPNGKFTQHRRLDLLREKLEAHTSGLTLADLAAMLSMTTRSVRRYLHELALLIEIESIEVRSGRAHLWRIKPSERGRTVALRRMQAYALLAPSRVFDVLRGSVIFDEIDVALRQVRQVALRPQGRTAVHGDVASDVSLEDRFAYVPPAPRAYGRRSEDVDAAFQAVAELAVLRFRYREEGSDDRPARITAHPYALVLHGGAMACIGRDVGRGLARTFLFDRMSELVASSSERFAMPADFSLADWLQGDFGVGRATRSVRLLVEFEPRVADAVRMRRVHPTQKLAVAADGRVRVSLSLPEVPEVLAQARRWILGFGAAARVVEPRDLAEELARELGRAAERYRR